MKDLERPGDVFRDLGPNWFAAVMGTGIVATAAATLPFGWSGLRVLATTVRVLAAGALVALCAAWAVHRIRFGISLFASVIIITLLWSSACHAQDAARRHGADCVDRARAARPVGHRGREPRARGSLALPAPYRAGADVFALLYGIPTWGFAMLWLAIAATLTVRAARHGMPFPLTWWSFTFPVGTVVTGTILLATRTGSDMLRDASALLFLLLVVAWLVVAARTAAGAARGRLFLPALVPERS